MTTKTSGAGKETVLRAMAQWTLELITDCPHCEERFDILDTPDFWEWSGIEACEHGTPRSKNVKVTCVKCSKDFTVETYF